MNANTREKVARAKPTVAPAKPKSAPRPAKEIAAEWVPLSTLKAWKENPRRNAEAIPSVSASLIRFGWGRALVARSENAELIVGHTAAAAAKRLAALWADPACERGAWHPEAIRTAKTGFVPVRFKNISEGEAHLLALADNKIGEIAEWDDSALAVVLKDAAASGVNDLEVTGFLKSELDRLLGDIPREGEDGDGESAYREQYGVIVICKNESDQKLVYERLQADGYECKVVVT